MNAIATVAASAVCKVDPMSITLKHGSHSSPERGMCFNEAVAFIAGEPHSDTPQCACPTLRNYSLTLNDSMGDKYRHLLNPHIIGMIGTRNPALQQKRAEHMVRETTRRVLPLVFEAIDLTEAAARLRALPQNASMEACREAAKYAAEYAAKYAANAAKYAAEYAANAAEYAANAAEYAAKYAAEYAALRDKLEAAVPLAWQTAADILGEAIAIKE